MQGEGKEKAQRVPSYPEGREDSKGSVMTANTQKVSCCRRGALKSATLQEGRVQKCRGRVWEFGAILAMCEGATLLRKIRVPHWPHK